MNKRRVNQWIAPAYEALVATGIAKNGVVDAKFRSQISSFGAAVVMGSLKAAVAFFAQQGGAMVQREKLLQAIYYTVTKDESGTAKVEDPKNVFRYVCEHDTFATREKFTDAAIALKLAMNLFDMGKGETDEESESAVQ